MWREVVYLGRTTHAVTHLSCVSPRFVSVLPLKSPSEEGCYEKKKQGMTKRGRGGRGGGGFFRDR